MLSSALSRVLARAGPAGPVSPPAAGARPLVLTGALAAAASRTAAAGRMSALGAPRANEIVSEAIDFDSSN